VSALPAQRLQDAWQQCARHLHHLQHALKAVQSTLPLSAADLKAMDDEAVQDWDQLILRFAKLQDTMGSRLFPAVLDLLHEGYEDRPMLDKLHRLEKLGYLGSAEQWHGLRAIRNRFAHDYPEDDALKAAYLNEAAVAVAVLDALLKRFEPLLAAPHTSE
jgi:hypothetical protein